MHLSAPRTSHHKFLVAVTILAALVSSGCVSSKYKMARPTALEPLWLDLTTKDRKVEAVVHTVCYFEGPGSWKQEAYWDEYLVTVINRSNRPLVIESAMVTGLAPVPSFAGDQPWVIENQSRTLAKNVFGLAKDVSIQLGSGLGATTLAVGVGAAMGGSGLAAVGGAAAGAVVALPTVVGVSIYRNYRGRREVEQEFHRRRMVLPASVEPDQAAKGSLFFPITPGPQRLALHCRNGTETFDVTVKLAPLARLHLKQPSSAPNTNPKQPLPAPPP